MESEAAIRAALKFERKHSRKTRKTSYTSYCRDRDALARLDVAWLAAAVEVLGGPREAARKVGRDVRTVRRYLSLPVGHLSYNTATPFGEALGMSARVFFGLIMDQYQRENPDLHFYDE